MLLRLEKIAEDGHSVVRIGLLAELLPESPIVIGIKAVYDPEDVFTVYHRPIEHLLDIALESILHGPRHVRPSGRDDEEEWLPAGAHAGPERVEQVVVIVLVVFVDNSAMD